MISVTAFISEMEKIAACKARKGAMPIRVHNLAKKGTFDGRSKLKSKLATGEGKAISEAAKNLAKKHKLLGKAALIGGGIAAWETGKQGVKDWQTGRAYRKQMEQRG